MTQFEYVMVLMSLILGLGITQILYGLSNLILRWSQVKFYFPHLLCILFVFIMHIQEWWVNYEYSFSIKEWRFSMFSLLIVYPIILFIMARLLFPIRVEGEVTDLKVFYFKHYRKFYLFGFLMAFISIPQNLLLSDIGITDQFVQLGLSLFFLIPIFRKSESNVFHHLIALALTGFGIGYVIIFNPQLH